MGALIQLRPGLHLLLWKDKHQLKQIQRRHHRTNLSFLPLLKQQPTNPDMHLPLMHIPLIPPRKPTLSSLASKSPASERSEILVSPAMVSMQVRKARVPFIAVVLRAYEESLGFHAEWHGARRTV
jgi:hypothetical protein